MTKKRGPTQDDVATIARVSPMTVSRVITGRGVVANGTRTRVERVIEELGYVPNRLAGSMALARSNQVGVLVPSMTLNIFNQVAAGTTEELEKGGYNPVMGVTEYDTGREERLLESILSWRPAGVILTDVVHTRRTMNMLRNSEIPVIEILQITPDPIDMCVGYDHGKTGVALVDHLLQKGYRKFAYLGWWKTGYASSRRFFATRDRLEREGLPLIAPDLFASPPKERDGREGLAYLLSRHPDVDAVIFGNDLMAMGGLFHCMAVGIEVPGDLGIAGFSGASRGQVLPKPLTTVAVPSLEIGKRAARTVLNALAGQVGEKIVDLGFELIPGETT